MTGELREVSLRRKLRTLTSPYHFGPRSQPSSLFTRSPPIAIIPAARYSLLGLNERKQSKAPTRQDLIDKIKRIAALGDTLAGPISGATTITAGGDDDLAEDTDVDEAVQEVSTRNQGAEADTEDDVSVSSSLMNPFDSRHDEPVGPKSQKIMNSHLIMQNQLKRSSLLRPLHLTCITAYRNQRRNGRCLVISIRIVTPLWMLDASSSRKRRIKHDYSQHQILI